MFYVLPHVLEHIFYVFRHTFLCLWTYVSIFYDIFSNINFMFYYIFSDIRSIFYLISSDVCFMSLGTYSMFYPTFPGICCMSSNIYLMIDHTFSDIYSMFPDICPMFHNISSNICLFMRCILLLECTQRAELEAKMKLDICFRA